MSKKTRYHRHGGEIHIEVTEEGKLGEHVCIGKIDENRPDYQEHTKLIIRACNNHEMLLKACEEYIGAVDGIVLGIRDRKALATHHIRQAIAANAKAKEN